MTQTDVCRVEVLMHASSNESQIMLKRSSGISIGTGLLHSTSSGTETGSDYCAGIPE